MGLLLAGLAGAAEQGIDSINKQQVIDAQAERDAKMVESQKSLADYNSKLMQTRERESAKLRQEMLVEEENRKQSPEYIAAQSKAAESVYDAGGSLRAKQAQEALANYRLKSSAELESEISKLSDPKYLEGKKAEARATHINDSAGLIKAQTELAQQVLEEKKAELKMPYAQRQNATFLQNQILAKSKAIDTLTGSGTGTPDGLAALNKESADLNRQLTEIYKPYLPLKTDVAKVDPNNPLGLNLPKLEKTQTQSSTDIGKKQVTNTSVEQVKIDQEQLKAKRVADIEQKLKLDYETKFDMRKPGLDYLRNKLGYSERISLENELSQLKGR